MANFVFFLCAATSFVCAVLQWRAYLRAKSKFLLAMVICFGSIFLNNLLLIFDSLTGPDISFVTIRGLILLCGLSFVLFGFIWETI